VLLGLCLLALGFIVPLANSEMNALNARQEIIDAGQTIDEARREHLNAAEDALAGVGSSALLTDLAAELALLREPVDLDASARWTQQALTRSPSRAESWARLAFIEVLRAREFTDKSIGYLEHSFIIEPAGYQQFMIWRLEFMFAYWSQIPHTLQESTLRSLRMTAQWRGQNFALSLATKINNPDLTTRAHTALQIPIE